MGKPTRESSTFLEANPALDTQHANHSTFAPQAANKQLIREPGCIRRKRSNTYEFLLATDQQAMMNAVHSPWPLAKLLPVLTHPRHPQSNTVTRSFMKRKAAISNRALLRTAAAIVTSTAQGCNPAQLSPPALSRTLECLMSCGNFGLSTYQHLICKKYRDVLRIICSRNEIICLLDNMPNF